MGVNRDQRRCEKNITGSFTLSLIRHWALTFWRRELALCTHAHTHCSSPALICSHAVSLAFLWASTLFLFLYSPLLAFPLSLFISFCFPHFITLLPSPHFHISAVLNASLLLSLSVSPDAHVVLFYKLS